VASLDEHTAGPPALGGDGGGVVTDGSDNADAPEPTGELEIAITPENITVLPGDVISVELRLVKRPAGAVALRVDGAGFTALRADGTPEPSGDLPGIDAARDRRNVVIATDPTTAVGSTITASITATSDRPRRVQTKQIVVKTTSLDTTFGASGVLTGNLFATSSIEDYVVSLIPHPTSPAKTIVVAQGYPGQNGAAIGQGDVYVGLLTEKGLPLEPTINSGYGYWRYDWPNGTYLDQTVHAAAVSPSSGDAKRVVTVGTSNVSGLVLEVGAYLIDTLKPDTSFNGSGYLHFDASPGSDAAFSVAAQADGKIVVGGFSDGSATASTVTLFRFTTAGAPDATFGNGGVAKLTMPSSLAGRSVAGVAISSGGDIFFAPSALVVPDGGVDDGLLLGKAATNGTIGSSFASGGIARTPIATTPTNDRARALVVQADGKIVVVGTSFVDADRHDDVVVVRVAADGTLDPSFGPEKKGWVVTDLGLANESAVAAAIDASGNLFVAAKVGDAKTAVLRYDSGGMLTGVYGPACCAKTMTPSTIAVRSDGKVLVGGWTNATPSRDSAVMRLVP
jgi:uncharacterized delta-60 repeat protein